MSQDALERHPGGTRRHPSLRHVGGVGVPERMGMDARSLGSLTCLRTDRNPGTVGEGLAETAPSEVDEDRVVGKWHGPFQSDVVGHDGDCVLTDRNDAVRPILAGSNGQESLAPVDIVQSQCQRFTDAQAAILEEPDNGAIPIPWDRETGQKAVDLVSG